ncbi:DUF1572 family protein [Arachidicoccus ginsenosidivorans]|jgi:hypothetical protein|uniref:DUF1572 domain-containing protein n=1 Tax=Arachidicoccus ginsenosidivorans TaxID=496057 RepID=A0A5B8VPQ5_9BACT|nr:DUF1572 family protein [Arachidicoccus ginsenosidivorans]QEC72575.1 DUF1572 domain-containing protein [Arachidicoccus ginsenosidivorans]
MTENKIEENTFSAGFLHQAIKRLEGYKQMADKAISQLSDDQLFTAVATGSNSVAVIMQHMAGNMESRWTNFLTEDGEKSWRNRDQEFEPVENNRQAVLAYWERGWLCLLHTLKSLQPEDLEKDITIRGESLKAYDGIIRQLMHYSSHVGQIVYVAKWLSGADWQPLTIGKNQSQNYNQSMGYTSRHQ